MFHWLMHKMGWNKGHIETWWENGSLMIGFRCNKCGKLEGVTTTGVKREKQKHWKQYKVWYGGDDNVENGKSSK